MSDLYSTVDRKNKGDKSKYVAAKKKYGQNFLVDKNIVNKIVERVPKDCFVIEIGPGTGNLTIALSEKAKKVVAFEVDEDLVEDLHKRFENSNVTIYLKDFLEVDIDEVIEKESEGLPTVIVSNLPYYITTKLLTKIFEKSHRIDKVVVMVQKEVANRFTLKLDKKDYNAVNVLSEYYSDVSLVCNVDRKCFNPSPRVNSAVIEFVMKTPVVAVSNEEEFSEFVKACFKHRRKLLKASLEEYGIDDEALLKVGLNENSRVEEVTIDKMIALFEERK